MNLSDMTTQFTGLMNRRDLTSNTTLVTTFMNQAIMRSQRELRIPAMEKSVQVTITAPYLGLVIPADYLELIEIIPEATHESISRKSITRVSQMAATTGDPMYYCRRGAVWVLGPAPVPGDIIDIDYYAEFAPLLAPTDTNIISEIAWDLIVYAALSYAADWFTDKRAETFEKRYGQILADLQAQADADELDGTAAVQPALHYPDEF